MSVWDLMHVHASSTNARHFAATEAETATFAQMAARCGISALGVHGRFVSQRPRDPAHWSRIGAVVAAVPSSLPVIANGDVFRFGDFDRICAATGAAAAMAARAAEWNASVFRAAGPAPGKEVRRRYVEACMAWDNPLANSKYCLREMLTVAPGGLQSAEATTLHAAKTPAALAAAYKLDPGAGPALRAAAAKRAAAVAAGEPPAQ